MKRKIMNRTILGTLLGLSLWTAFTVLAAWLRGQWNFPAVSGHLVLKYGSELGAVSAQCVAAIFCGILWCNGALIFRETDWNLLTQTGVHAFVCMVPALFIAWFMHFMPRSLDGLMQYLRLFGVIYAVNWAVQYGHLRHSIKQINEKLNHKGETSMKKNMIRRPVVIAAVLLCVCLPVAGLATGNSGFFRDIMRGTAIVGSEYEQATGEIRVTAAYANQEVVVTAIFLMPEKVPFWTLEELAVGSCKIVDAEGKTVAEFENSEAAQITDGQAVIVLHAENLDDGVYTLRIESFIGSKKADQPLPMKGLWESQLTVE